MITRVDEDKWANENYNLPSALYFYYLSDDIYGWDDELTLGILGNCPAIQSVQYVPFIETTDLTINSILYDTQRFGENDGSRPVMADNPLVYRIVQLNNNVKTIGSFTCYNPTKSIGGKKNWRNESRLYNYPYSFAMLTDNLNTPIEIKYHLCKSNTNEVKVRNTISNKCSYGLFIEGYKGDSQGRMESMVSGDGHELPCSSSSYNQWFASNKNQVSQNILNETKNVFLQNSTLQKQLIPSLVSQATLNPSDWIKSGASMYNTYLDNKLSQTMNKQNLQNSIAMNLAQKEDLISTPNTILSMGSDVYYGLDKGSKKVHLYRFGLTEEYYEKLGDYFAMFGYKQNKVMKVNTRDRYFYNHIKTLGVNIEAKGIVRDILEEIKSIFDNGVTIWHIDREGVKVGDYSMDNYEV